MDVIDRGMLEILSRNCRISYRELGRKYDMSANAIRRRVLNLEESGVIDQYGIELSPAMIGSSFVFGILKTDGSRDEVEFVDLMGDHSCVAAAAAYTDGLYPFGGEYIEKNELLELGSYLRGLDGVLDLEIHPIIQSKGNKVDLSKLDLRVLSVLLEDPRMQVVDISERTGLTARRVRRIVKNLEESQAVRFTAEVEAGKAGAIPFLVRISWIDSMVGYTQVLDWLREEIGWLIWAPYVSSIEPTIFALFTEDNLVEVDRVARRIRSQDFITSVKVMIATHHKYFPSRRVRWLVDSIREAGYDVPDKWKSLQNESSLTPRDQNL
jgi:DNA-binding Lrp family transcriptional regulator